MTAFVLCLSVAAGAIYLLICSRLELTDYRYVRGPWDVVVNIWWKRWVIGVTKLAGMVDVHLGAITINIRYDKRTAEQQARQKRDRKLVDALVGKDTWGVE